MKVLVSDAKNYLKSKILGNPEFKKTEIQQLPKTLEGLVSLAKKIGVDISKITIEDVKVTSQSTSLSKVSLDMQKEEPKINLKNEKEAIKNSDVIKQKDDTVVSKSLKNNDEVLTPKQTLIKEQVVTKEQSNVKEPVITKVENKTQEQAITADKKSDISHEIKTSKSTLLFKSNSNQEHTTEQIVNVKQFKVEEKTPKERADETLKLLLRGEKVTQETSTLTKDFTLSTAKVIVSQPTDEKTKSLEALLKGSEGEQSNSKADSVVVAKADSFEVKVKEAKQMIKFISQDVKTAIEDYKSPFTRVKIQLNPQKLGDVDLTIVQRGKNLHINLSSNSSAINTLSMNVNELRTQLNNNGINNATLNFNNSQDNSSNSQQQQNRQNEQKADAEYNYFDNEETNEEILSSLEIVVPNYA